MFALECFHLAPQSAIPISTMREQLCAQKFIAISERRLCVIQRADTNPTVAQHSPRFALRLDNKNNLIVREAIGGLNESAFTLERKWLITPMMGFSNCRIEIAIHTVNAS